MKEQKRLAELVIRGGFPNWVQSHLLDVVLETHFWIKEEDVLGMLAEATDLVPQGVDKVLKNGEIFRLRLRLKNGYSALTTDIVDIVQMWLGSAPGENQITVAAMLLVTFGTRSHIDWWQDLEPKEGLAHTVWSNALYSLKRKRWHD